MKLYPIRFTANQGADFVALNRDELIFKAHAHPICRAECIMCSMTVHDFASTMEDLVAHALENGIDKPRTIRVNDLPADAILIEKITRKDFYGNTRPIDKSFFHKLISGTLNIYVDTKEGQKKALV
jgi:hypothetical protein